VLDVTGAAGVRKLEFGRALLGRSIAYKPIANSSIALLIEYILFLLSKIPPYNLVILQVLLNNMLYLCRDYCLCYLSVLLYNQTWDYIWQISITSLSTRNRCLPSAIHI